MTKTYSNRSNARRAAIKAGIPADAIRIEEVDGAFAYTDTRAGVILSTEDGDLGLVPADTAAQEAQRLADELGCAVYTRDQITDDVIATAQPKRRAGGRMKKLAAVLPEQEPKEPKVEAPSGMVAKIIDLATRECGVTPAELNALTNWKGAPWKWLMQNPKKTGFADRWGYNLQVAKEGRAVSYRLVKA